MKIVILNGSPKGMQSVTMMHIQYLEKKFPQHEFEYQHISQRIRRLAENPDAFDEVISSIRAADGVLWATPVYYFIVPGQYKRFLELVFERGLGSAFYGKYCAVLTTSIHFFDHTSNNYLRSVCEDLGMKFVESYPAHMDEMMSEEGRSKLVHFVGNFFQAITEGKPTQRQYHQIRHQTIQYQPQPAVQKIDVGGRKVLVLHDAGAVDHNLSRMVERFQDSFEQQVEVINLHSVDIKGGCLGCLHCGYDNECSYGDKDGFTAFYDEKVRKADMLVFAGRIHDRYLSSRWKTYFDRSFFRGHAPSLIGKQMAYLISGPLSQIPNLQQVLQAYTQMQRCNLAGIVSDEVADSGALDALIQHLAERMVGDAAQGYFRPVDFLYVGGHKLFRDDIFSNLRTVFQADHRVYKKLGIYDFPTRNVRQRMMNGVASLVFKIPRIRRGFQGMIKTGMLRGYQQILEREELN